MSLEIVSKTNIGPGILYHMVWTDNLQVLQGTIVASTTDVTILADLANQAVLVFGAVGGVAGIRFESSANSGSIVVGTGGSIVTDGIAIQLASSSSSLINYGEILSGTKDAISIDVAVPSRKCGRLVNYGTIQGAGYGIFVARGGDLRITNYGTIAGDKYSAIVTDAGNDVLINRGRITGDVDLFTGDNTLFNRSLITGDVAMRGGSDLVDNRTGTIEGNIALGGGNDIFRPGTSIETVDGGSGDDILDFRLSGTVRVALDGSIDATGAAAGDTYVDFLNVIGSTGNDTLIGDSYDNLLIGGGGNDILTGQDGADTLIGGRGVDTLDGGNGADNLDGGESKDILIGGADNDTLSGGFGNDTLTGGPGVDTLTGDAGADKFVFSLADVAGSTTADGNHDRITDFSRAEGDRIDLSAIDANVNQAKDQPFAFIGAAAFHHVSGELRIEATATGYFVQGDTNGDGVADFTIGVDTAAALVATDFVL